MPLMTIGANRVKSHNITWETNGFSDEISIPHVTQVCLCLIGKMLVPSGGTLVV